MHNRNYDDYGRSIPLYSPGLFSYTSAYYTLTIYPTGELFDVYSTKNPVIAPITTFAIILFTAILYLLYDFFVRQEFHHKAAIMEAKRKYMRFISHEVRTPLNSVVMGTRLLQDDMIKFSKDMSNGAKLVGTEGPERALTERTSDWTNLSGDVLTNAQSAVDVLNDLLNWDKIESDTLKLELTFVSISTLVKRTALEFKISARSKEIDLNVDLSKLSEAPPALESASTAEIELGKEGNFLAARDLWVIGDSIRITQVIRNFLSNAVKFTPERGRLVLRF